MSKEVNNTKVERKTTVEVPKKINIPLVNGCLVPIAVFALMIVCIRECKRSGIRLEQEQFKLEQMKKGALVDTTPAITPDTLKIFGREKAYIPMLKLYNSDKQK